MITKMGVPFNGLAGAGYTHEGVDQCIDWLNQKYIDDKDKWDEAFNSRMNAE